MFITGLTVASLSASIAVYCYYFGSDDDSTGVVFLIACIACIIGIFMMVFGRLKQRNSFALKSIENKTNTDYCAKCGINVANQNGQCPLCGNDLEKR